MKAKLSQKLLDKVKSDYHFLADAFHQSRKFPWAELIKLSNYVKDGQSVLDLGCGNGRLLEVLKDKKIDYLGLDNCSTLIKYAQENQLKVKEENPGIKIKFLEKDILNIGDLPSNYFDIVFLIAVLHHIPTKKLRLKILQEIRRILKPGGYLLMTNWNLFQPRFIKYIFNIFYRFKRMPLNLVFYFGEVYIPWHHQSKTIYRYVHAFNLKEIKELIKRTELKLIKNNLIYKGEDVDELTKGWNIITIARK